MKTKIFEGTTAADAAAEFQKWLDSKIVKIVTISGYAHKGGHVFIVVYEYESFGWSVRKY